MTMTVSKISLEPFDSLRDLPLLERWLQTPHVSRWWGAPEAHLATLSQRSNDTHALVSAAGRAVGYLCWQTPSKAELASPGLADLPERLVDIDILIGEPDALGSGIGERALDLLLARLRRAGAEYAGAATSNGNLAAIRVFEKVGFRLFRTFEEVGPEAPDATTYRYLLADLRDADPVRDEG